MKNRFDLETDIMALYFFKDQLGLISEGILEHDISNDDVVNAIEGLRVLLDIHVTKMMDTMCQAFKLDQHNDEIYTQYI